VRSALRHSLGGVVLLACVLAPATGQARQGSSSVTPAQAAALGSQAFLYGFPLLETERVRQTATSVRCPDAFGDSPVNSFSHARRFTTPARRTIVAPNVDTLYSIAHLDLGRGRVVLSHPDMGRRYFVFQLLDPYTNTIGYVGTRSTGRRAGRFAITWSRHPGHRVRGARVVRSKYRRVWVIGRTLARGRADQLRALRLMRRYRLAPPGGPRKFPRGCHPGKPRKAKTATGLAFLDVLGAALKANPPPARDRPLLQQLAAAGVGPGLRPERAGLSPAALEALGSSVDTIAAALPGAVRSTLDSAAAMNHGWSIPRDEIGDYGIDYQYRAGVALVGLGANTRAEAVYPTALRDSDGTPLDGHSRYRIVFAKGQAPPARAFWSLTMYDADGYLVANPQKRYAIGDSHPPLARRSDGSIVVVLQRTKPAEARVNWLPTPAGPFRLNLRLYLPSARVLSGAWQPPPVVKTD
jgi:hypothetical protein